MVRRLGRPTEPDATRHVRAERTFDQSGALVGMATIVANIPISLLQLAETMKNSDTNNFAGRPEERPALDLSKYKLVWEDGPDGSAGSKPADHWFFDGWGAGKWRDAYYSEKDAYLDGAGHLVIRSRMEGEAFKTSYLQTYDWKVPKSRWTTFGPGDGKYIETRVMLSDMQAQGPWAAFSWLLDPHNPYDGNPGQRDRNRHHGVCRRRQGAKPSQRSQPLGSAQKDMGSGNAAHRRRRL